ncbi:MAG: DUF4921 family protein [Chloroherpetonaceae bacterium]|nr:DUF4921 family protein [Chloroherpetonaceae bacterium]
MPDGTVKQINPFNGTEVWSVPGRGRKPLDHESPETVETTCAQRERGLLFLLRDTIL